MLGGTLGQDVDLEVGLKHLLLVLGIVGLAIDFVLALVLCELLRQIVLFFFQATLDDLGSGQQTLLQLAESFVLDDHRRLDL